MLNAIEVLPANGQTPDSAVIFIHGYGANGADLIGLAENFSESLPGAVFLSPDAPERCEMSPMGYQWFSLRSWDEDYVLAGVEKVAPLLDEFVDDVLSRYRVDSNRLALVGFSQGTIMALHVALRRDKPLGGVIGFSGALVGGAGLIETIKSRPPVLLVHGMMDMVVPFISMSDAERWLKMNNVPVQTLTRPTLGHGIDFEGIEAGKEFLVQVIK